MNIRSLLLVLLLVVAGCSSDRVRFPFAEKTPVLVKGKINRVVGAPGEEITVTILGIRDWVRPDISGGFTFETPPLTSRVTVGFETSKESVRVEIDDIPYGTATVLAEFDVRFDRSAAELESVKFLSPQGKAITE